jgi:GntR family transcriptional regulator
MQFVNVNREAQLSLHEQVAAEIRRAIAEGEIGPGERLPPAIDLGKVLGVNKNTVIRSLHVLRAEGLLDFTRGRGIRVSGTVEKAAVLEKVGELVQFARHLGYQRQEIVAMIEGLP